MREGRAMRVREGEGGGGGRDGLCVRERELEER